MSFTFDRLLETSQKGQNHSTSCHPTCLPANTIPTFRRRHGRITKELKLQVILSTSATPQSILIKLITKTRSYNQNIPERTA